MFGTNGNTEICIVEGDTVRLVPANPPPQVNDPLPRIRLVAQRIRPTEPADPMFPAARPDPTLREVVDRWRNGKLGLADGTIKKLDSHINPDFPYSLYKTMLLTYTEAA